MRELEAAPLDVAAAATGVAVALGVVGGVTAALTRRRPASSAREGDEGESSRSRAKTARDKSTAAASASIARAPFLVLAVHLCGTLSVKAVEMFNAHDTASMLCLKPCCLPEWNHTYTHDAWVFPKTRDGDEARFGEHRVFSLQKSSEDASRDEETPRDAERHRDGPKERAIHARKRTFH